MAKGSSINDVTQIWIIFDTPPPIVTIFNTKIQYCCYKILDTPSP